MDKNRFIIVFMKLKPQRGYVLSNLSPLTRILLCINPNNKFIIVSMKVCSVEN